MHSPLLFIRRVQNNNETILDRGQISQTAIRRVCALWILFRAASRSREVDDGRSSLLWERRQRDTVMHANVNISTPLKSIQMCLFRWKINKAVREKHSVLQNPADNVISPSSLHTLREVFSSLKLSLFTQLCFTHVTMTFNNKSGKLHLRRSL